MNEVCLPCLYEHHKRTVRHEINFIKRTHARNSQFEAVDNAHSNTDTQVRGGVYVLTNYPPIISISFPCSSAIYLHARNKQPLQKPEKVKTKTKQTAAAKLNKPKQPKMQHLCLQSIISLTKLIPRNHS